MSSWLYIGELLLGIAVLYWGSVWLVDGSESFARGFGVRRVVIALTVTAYGHSAPELAIATKAALEHSQPIALGTVIGSCAANITLILGLTALIRPPTIRGHTIRREIPVLVGSAIAVPILFRNGVLSRLEGALLIGCAFVFTIASLTIASRLVPDDDGEDLVQRVEDSRAELGGRARPKASRLMSFGQILFGLVLLIVGAKFFLDSARHIGAGAGMSERMIGITIVALGCSLPELLTSVRAATLGMPGLTLESVISSNLLNVFLVLGVTAYLRPIHLGERMHVVDLVGLVIITLLGVLALRSSRKISRLEGALLVSAYIGFIVACAIL